ncbi:wax ester/triacylglycerol synthase domain-containing protein, partial [Lapillicoccus sp.]
MRVSDRLSSLDASLLYLEEPTTMMHVGSVMVFDEPAGS